mgnify:FL=1
MLYEDLDMKEVLEKTESNIAKAKVNAEDAAIGRDENLHIPLDAKHQQAKAMFRMQAYCGFFRK